MKFLIVQNVTFGGTVIINMNNVTHIHEVDNNPDQSVFYFDNSDSAIQVNHTILNIAHALSDGATVIDLDKHVQKRSKGTNFGAA